MRAAHQRIGLLAYQLVVSVVAGAGISCALVYRCPTQILAYQLGMSVVAGAGISAGHECNA